MPGLRSYSSLSALPSRNSNTSSKGNHTDSNDDRHTTLQQPIPHTMTFSYSANGNINSDTDNGAYSMGTPTPFSRMLQCNQQARAAEQRSLLNCLTPTPTPPAISPVQSNVPSLSPSPSPSPFMAPRPTHRRLAFTPSDMAALSSGSVAGNNGVSGSSANTTPQPSLFTPPATKLVRPDPSAFASTGLLTKKQQARSRSNSSFITPETPCKRTSAFGSNTIDTAAAASASAMAGEDADSGLVTPNTTSFQSAPKPPIDMDPFRLGKHRNPSMDSLRKLRKKPHLGPVTEEGEDGLQSLFDTPCRPRQNTLVDDDFMQKPPPGFRIPSMDGLGAAAAGTSTPTASRPLPPSFAPQHQLLMQSLAAENMVDPDMAPWDVRRANKRWSWAASSDVSSVSSAATLAPSSTSPVIKQGSADGGNGNDSDGSDGTSAKRRPQHRRHHSQKSASLFGTGNSNGYSIGAGAEQFSDDVTMELDVDIEDDVVVAADDNDDDVFGGGQAGNGGSNSSCSSNSSDPRSAQSPRIMAMERPQMPQIVQGCATNYAHFLTREYFFRSDNSLPFLSPTNEFHVDGLGYLDYFAHQFEIISRAGEGNFSSVYSVRSLVDGQLYAVKKTRQPFTGRQERARRLREVELLWTVPPATGIVKLVNAWEQFGHLYMQFELCESGSLANYLELKAHMDSGRLSEARAWAILAHACHAVNRLHDCDIAHLDIKPANFLMGPDFEAAGAEQHEGWLKLADFGHAVRLPREPTAWVEEGDREYLAPEVLRGIYTKAADVFSLGMMMLEIVADIVLPDNGVEWHKLREGCFDDQSFVGLPYSPELLETIKHMLHPEPSMRPSLQQVLSLNQCSIYTSPSASHHHHHHHHHHELMRAATAGAPSKHPMTTRSAAAAAARRTTSAPSADSPSSSSHAQATAAR
ncbi:mitosis inhibitor protein kinase swe1 [Dipsacomyces acuminosporus]|nr:mitosis inhibitor protein kinase swe1 [Dipsacomyces acuminosporus]